MGMAAILAIWPEPFEQTFVPPSQGGSTWNLASIGPVVSEEKMFENVDIIHTYLPTNRWQKGLPNKLTNEPNGHLHNSCNPPITLIHESFLLLFLPLPIINLIWPTDHKCVQVAIKAQVSWKLVVGTH